MSYENTPPPSKHTFVSWLTEIDRQQQQHVIYREHVGSSAAPDTTHYTQTTHYTPHNTQQNTTQHGTDTIKHRKSLNETMFLNMSITWFYSRFTRLCHKQEHSFLWPRIDVIMSKIRCYCWVTRLSTEIMILCFWIGICCMLHHKMKIKLKQAI